MKYFFSILLLLFFTGFCQAQEIELNVTIDRQQTPDLPKNITDDLKNAILNFVNNRRWTNDQFQPQERIKMNMLITLDKETTLGRYVSITQIQVVRPIYGGSYESILISFIDKNFDFEFAQGQPLDYNENVYMNGLVSLLSFYSYVALALDYDSFGKLGGSPHLEKAWNIANVAQSSNPPPLRNGGKNGWENNEFSNRFALINHMNNQQFIPFREGMYTYHREAMDNFEKAPEEARKKILDVLKKIKTTRQLNPISILITSFFFGKKDELIQIYSRATSEMKNESYNLLREIDGVNSDKYSAILK